MQKIWLASDTHFGHKKILDFTKRTEGFEERFLTAWDNIVGSNDVVMLLGDIAWGKVSYWFGRLREMPGQKVLLMGNHDRNKPKWYSKFVDRVVPFNESLLHRYEPYGNIMFTHIPAFPSVLTSYDERFLGLSHKFNRQFDTSSCILNVHGHTHGVANERHNTIDVSLDVIGEQLVTIDQVFNQKFKS